MYLTWLLAIVLGIGVGLYRPAGFNYPLVFSVSQLHEGGSPFSLYINIAKLLAGYITVYLLISCSAQAKPLFKTAPSNLPWPLGWGFCGVDRLFCPGLGVLLEVFGVYNAIRSGEFTGDLCGRRSLYAFITASTATQILKRQARQHFSAGGNSPAHHHRYFCAYALFCECNCFRVFALAGFLLRLGV